MNETNARTPFLCIVNWQSKFIVGEKKRLNNSALCSDAFENLFVNFSAWLYRYLSRMLTWVFVWTRIWLNPISKWIVQQ